jgi:hypothetical protein
VPRFFKEVEKRTGPSQAEVRRAKDFWAEVFQDVIIAQVDDSSAGHAASADLVRFAGEIADQALAEMEKRWGKI